MNRNEELNVLAKKLGKLESDFKVKIISSNGYTDAIIVDQINGKGYEYQRGTMILAEDE
ncbi:hypothetical protein NST63_27435 [Heyndrickxia sp. FSL W8-0496]|uniref:hypothetical protein n=1 Tax=Heyndrickxia TaxID=2837504 RepID=UPI001C0EAEDA|nr:hypothetical protein [Heyndrickxia oleronia]MBU5215079.1 hypothetical protein [Heyndrickxia oleronia]